MRVAVIFGSPSVEYLGSCVSGTHVADVLSKEHEVKRILIDLDGSWEETKEKFSYADDKTNRKFYEHAQQVAKPKWQKPDLLKIRKLLDGIDVVVPMTHGPYGESGNLQGFFEILKIPFTGPTIETCVLTQNKDLIKILCKQNDIPVSPFFSFSASEWKENHSKIVSSIKGNLKFPVFVKPNDGGSSIGLSKVKSPSTLVNSINEAVRYSNRVIVEEGIDAFEIECAVIGNNDLTVPNEIGEVIPSNEFYDLEAKYFKPSLTIVPSKNIDHVTKDRIFDLAKKIYKLARSSSYSRIDFLVDKKSKIPYLNEFTALPGCTEYSLFPQIFVKSGWKEIDLWNKIINYSLQRGN